MENETQLFEDFKNKPHKIGLFQSSTALLSNLSSLFAAGKSAWRDLNPRPPAPKAGALARLRYTPFRVPGTRFHAAFATRERIMLTFKV